MAKAWSANQLYLPLSATTKAYVQKRSGGFRSMASTYGFPPSTISMAMTE